MRFFTFCSFIHSRDGRFYWLNRNAEPTVQTRWLRFFRTEDAFYLLVRKVLRHEGLGGKAG
ncbi:hypothetical protein FM050_28730 [Bacillus thuringiensis]|uniref:Uncharacterized protein n=1 Tax=Bacillus cereus TaxID=1396 RepID=A0A9X7QMQ8_BACCE|nr:hypothetical protein CCZ40_31885 [Bacillus thuringiensis]QDZ76017.1 hypothetical protein D0437_24255 [Bacillus cereus]QTM17612.1 hypothetical protein FM050_28730 [Bacillus thuringiensis]TBY08463.1 hypothetical protein E0M42_03180 [Bacillus thuringiensis]